MTSILALFTTYTVYNNIKGSIESRKRYGDLRIKPELYGIYKVANYKRNNDSIPSLNTDSLYWKQMFVDYTYGGLKFLNDEEKYYRHEVDTIEEIFTFFRIVHSGMNSIIGSI